MKRSSLADFVVLIFVAGGALLLLYGWLKFPFAPVRPVGEKFFDKQNNERTAEEFQAFQTWQNALFVYFGGALTGGLIIAVVDKAPAKKNA